MTEQIYEYAGKRIRDIREREGFTREQLAEKIGISTKHLYEIEVKGRGFSAKILYLLARELHSSTDFILSGKVNYDLNQFPNEKKEKVSEILNYLYTISIE